MKSPAKVRGPNLRDQKKEETRQRIIASSNTLFTSHGFLKTTIDDISDMSGVSRQTFYSHFSDKNDVLRIIVAEYFPRASQIFAQMPGPAPSFEDVHKWVLNWTDFTLREQTALLTLMEVASASFERLPDIHTIMERLFRELAERIPAFAATQRDDAIGLRARARAETLMYAMTWAARVGSQSSDQTFRAAMTWDAAELIHDFIRAPHFVAAGVELWEQDPARATSSKK